MYSLRIPCPNILASILALALSASVLPHLQSATIAVPGDHATVQAAVNAAADGDIIEITNSAVYNEDVTIAKTLTLRGAEGQRPTIQNANSIERFAHLGIIGPDCLGTVVRAAGCQLSNITFSNPQVEADAAGVSSALTIIAPGVTTENCTITTVDTAPGDNVGVAVVDLDLPTGGNPPMDTLFKDCLFDTNKFGLAISWFIAPAIIPTVTVDGCTFTNNTGSSLEMDTGNVQVINCTFMDNPGTGIEVGAGSVSVVDSVFARNGLQNGCAINVELATNWDETAEAPMPSPVGEGLPAGSIQLSRCIFYAHGDPDIALDPTVRVHEGTLNASHCIFTENYSNHLVMDNSGEEIAPAQVFIDHCDFYRSLLSSEIVIYDMGGPQQITFQIKNSILTEGDDGLWSIENEFWEPAPGNELQAHYVAFYDPSLLEGDLIMEELNNLYFSTGLPPYNNTDPTDPTSFMLPTGNALLTAGENGTYLGARGTGVEPHPPILVAIEQTETGIRLCWNSQNGRTYEVQQRSDLDSANWEAFATVPSAGETTCWESATDGTGSRFWRIVLP